MDTGELVSVANIVFRWLILIICTIGLVAWIAWSLDDKSCRAYAYGAVLWMLHISIFYIVIILTDGIEPLFLNVWSNAIRLQGVLTFAGAGLVLWKTR